MTSHIMASSEEHFSEGMPDSISLQLEKAEDLRYGENPHQRGARYRFVGNSGRQAEGRQAEDAPRGSWWDTAKQHGGKQLSYLNLNDSEAAWRLACAFGSEFEGSAAEAGKVQAVSGRAVSGRAGRRLAGRGQAENEQAGTARAAAVVVKHANPCGAAIADDIATAWERAHACDPTSAFGGVVALNRPVDASLAERITANFLEALIAPGYDKSALDVLAKKKNLRVLEAIHPPAASLHFRSIDGGLLVQEAAPLPDFSGLCRKLELLVGTVADADTDSSSVTDDADEGELQESSRMEIVAQRPPTPQEIRDMAFAWVVAAATQSNAIVFAKDLQAVGVGAGQQNRRDAAMLATAKAGNRAKGAACASDAFFPFRDGLDQAADAGCTAVIQPGGSIRDEEVIAAADEHGIAMIFTHERRFLH